LAAVRDDPMAFADDEAEVPRKPNGQAREAPTEPLFPIDPAILEGLPVPPRQWLVRDWVPMSRATSLYGAGGEGKTLLAQMLATACAVGGNWLGLTVKRCRSLLVFCEDDQDEMHRRQEDINRHFGCTFADLTAMRWLPRLGDNNSLMRFDGGQPSHTTLFEELLRVVKEHGAELIIVDTLADIFTGNENDRAQARVFAQMALGLLARETQGAVLTLAHPSRIGINTGSGESGSTTWIGTFRSQLYLETPRPEEGEPPEPDLRVLTRKKSNAARRNETIELRWENGVFLPIRPTTGILASIERRNCEQVFLRLLDKTAAEGQPVSSNTRSGNYAPRLFSRRPDRERFQKADFEWAMQALFAEGEITSEPYGRKGDLRFRIVRRQQQEEE
jgi:RecA-family ATPase